MKFKGDIIITDPCYICNNKENDLWDDDDIDILSGDGIDKYGFTNYIWRGTLYGDWSCSVFEVRNASAKIPSNEITAANLKKDTLGSFCADAGLVGVFLLDEVLRYNPYFDYHIKRKWTTALIKDFDGEIEDHVIGDDPEVVIRGIGNINFITRQTGF